ncbi:hypothetical protein ES705_50499 [subsurface metagenome]
MSSTGFFDLKIEGVVFQSHRFRKKCLSLFSLLGLGDPEDPEDPGDPEDPEDPGDPEDPDGLDPSFPSRVENYGDGVRIGFWVCGS